MKKATSSPMPKKSHPEKDNEKYLNHIISNIPHKPGVYRFKDKNGTVIYVGKAVDLQNRVSSYFKNGKDHSVKTAKLVSNIADISYTVVGTDLEALMLETNLIKEFKPKYNILMKDDKNFVYIKITVNEDYPRIFITRQVQKDKARYFGPKTAQHKVEKTLKVLKKVFPYRHCQLEIEYEGPNLNRAIKRHRVRIRKAGIKYPCIDYHIKRCVAPCIGLVTPEEYKKIIDNVIDFLEGRHDELIAQLKNDMAKAASEKKFETAAKIRDRLLAIEDIMESQRISAPDHKNLDVINYAQSDERAFFNLFQVRNGKLVNQENFELLGKENAGGPEILLSFLQQYYDKATDLPKDILVPHDIPEQSSVEEWLSDQKGQKVKIMVPSRGRNDKLLELSLQNAKNFARLSEVKWQGKIKSDREKALQSVGDLLGLDAVPKRMECYDISHSGGTATVASMVVFINGFPRKEDYRKFKLHNDKPGAPDDYASMKEVLKRRLNHLKPSISGNSYKILKPAKKDLEKIRPEGKPDNNFTRTIYKITLEQNYAGYVAVDTDPAGRRLVSSLKLETRMELRPLIKKIAEKTKCKRLYLRVPESATNEYEENGCTLVKKIPDGLAAGQGKSILVYELSKQKSDDSLRKKPDLIIMDGGKGQLNVAVKVLKENNFDIPVISIAKKNEEIFLPGRPKPAEYGTDTALIHMIRHIRDEAHRFAVNYQRERKDKDARHSVLDEIFGLGDTGKKKLLQRFGSVEGVCNATLYELESVVGKKNAIKIKEKLS